MNSWNILPAKPTTPPSGRRGLCSRLAVLVLVLTCTTPCPARPTPREPSLSAAFAALQKWDYRTAENILQRLAAPPYQRVEARRWLERIQRIRSAVDTLRVAPGANWENIALREFQDAGFASRLATFNGMHIFQLPRTGSAVFIPRYHREKQLALSAYDNPKTAEMTDLAVGIAHMRRALKIDPYDSDLRGRLAWADKVYAQRTLALQVDSLDRTADAMAAAERFTPAIRQLQKAEELKPDPKRKKRIHSLILLRNTYLPRWFDLGNRRFRKNDLHGALQAWRWVAEVNPRYRDVTRRIAKTERMLRILEGPGASDSAP